MTRSFTCILCPNGCTIQAETENGRILSVAGAGCPKGTAYVRQEILNPMRTISSSVALRNGVLPLASVRLNRPVPRQRLTDVMAEIGKLSLDAPVRIGQVALENVLGLGSDVIVTKNIARKEDLQVQQDT